MQFIKLIKPQTVSLRLRIRRLENAAEFDPQAWNILLSELWQQGRIAAWHDAHRRMVTQRRRMGSYA